MTVPAGPGFADFADFADRVGTGFTLHLPGGAPVPMVLTECTAGAPGSFALLFKAGAGAPAEQAMYELSAPGWGPEVVFLVPVAHRPEPQFPLEYQAIFTTHPVPDAGAGSVHRLEEEAR